MNSYRYKDELSRNKYPPLPNTYLSLLYPELRKLIYRYLYLDGKELIVELLKRIHYTHPTTLVQRREKLNSVLKSYRLTCRFCYLNNEISLTDSPESEFMQIL